MGQGEKIPDKYVISFLILIFLLLGGYSLYVRTYGVYVLAKKVGIIPGGKNGSSSKYEYHFNNKTYGFTVGDYGKGDKYIFAKILVEYPSCFIVPNLEVSNCLKDDSLLLYIWSEVPKCK